MLEFFGRFHPVFVHLPIGILLLACICIFLSFKARFANLKPAISIMLLLGALSAIVSCISGYLLANGGDYNGELVDNHQWMGFGVAGVSILLLIIYNKIKSNFVLGAISGLLILSISITGHMGGSLTHGSDYLTAPLLRNSQESGAAIPAIANVQDAFVYEDAIKPLFKNRCYSCHGSEKQKGKLRLDEESYILKGGEDGHTLVKGKAEESELIKRVLLPLNDEDHMAPKEKPQLTANEIALLRWWIDNGADFKKKFKDLPQPASLKPVLVSLQKGESSAEPATQADEIPKNDVSAVDVEVLKKFNELGVTIIPAAQNTNYLSANFVNVQSIDKTMLDLIKSIDKQLLWLKLDNNKVNNGTLKALKNAENLTKLSLNFTSITDAGLAYLKDLHQLKSLSLVGTKVTANGIRQLKALKKLKFIYLYQTQISPSDLPAIKKLFPKAVIDTGGYQLPAIPKDTIVFSAP